jgi:hypothetical protein
MTSGEATPRADNCSSFRPYDMHIGLPIVSYTLPLNVASCLPAPNGCTAGNELVSLTPRFNQVTIGVGFGL